MTSSGPIRMSSGFESVRRERNSLMRNYLFANIFTHSNRISENYCMYSYFTTVCGMVHTVWYLLISHAVVVNILTLIGISGKQNP